MTRCLYTEIYFKFCSNNDDFIKDETLFLYKQN